MRLKLSLLLVFIITYSWSQTTKTFAASGTFTVPVGVTNINVEAWGGGGSGGGASGAGLLLGRGAAGGGGGAYASATLTVTPGAILNVVVAGQTSGTTGGNGTTGGSSKIAGYEASLLAVGGSGGGANNAGGDPLGGTGGLVTNSVGTIRLPGFGGINGNSWSLLSLLLTSGAGGTGANFGGAGGAGVGSLILGNAPGNAGTAPGGGGSGAINSALGTAQVGGVGGAGKVIITYTIPACPTYNITGTTAANICISEAESPVTVVSSALSLPVGSYVVTYNRSSPSAAALTANMTVSTAGTGTFTAVGLTTAGSSTITITNLNLGACSSNIITNNTALINISPVSVGGIVSGGTSVCLGNTSGVLTLSGHTGSIVKWQSSVSPFSTWTDIVNTTAIYTSGPLRESTQFRAVVQSNICNAANSTATTVTISSLPGISLSASALDLCSASSERRTPLFYSATSGSPVSYSITWSASPENSFVTVTDEQLFESKIAVFVPEETPAGTYTGTLTVKNADGCVSESSVFTVTVKDIPSIGSFGVMYSVCASTNSQTGSLEYSFISGNPTSYSIAWNSDANAALLEDQGDTPFAFQEFGGNIDTIVIPANVPGGTYHGLLRVSNGACSSSRELKLTISPAAAGGTVTGGTTIASGSTSELLTLSGNTGSVVNWQSSVSPFTTFTDIENTELTYTSGSLTETTQFRAVVQSGVCDNVNSEPTTVTVETVALTITVSDTFNRCSDGTLESVNLYYSVTAGAPVTYSIVWDSSPVNSFVVVTEALLLESSITIAVPLGTPAGNYGGTLTVKNASGFVSPGSAFIIKIVASATIATTGIIAPVTASTSLQTSTLSYSASAGTPYSYSIFWDSAANASGLSNQSSTFATFSPGGGSVNTIKIPANVPLGTYFGNLFVTNGNCNESYPVSLVINSAASGITSKFIEAPNASNKSESFKIISGMGGLETGENTISISTLNKVINVEAPNQTINQVFIYDVSGTLLYKKDGVSDSSWSINNLRPGNQVLVVKVVLNNNYMQTKKVIF